MSFQIASVPASAARQIEQQLRTSIISMDLAPGERLSEQEIAMRFGVSRQPVREALIALSKAQLVAIRPQRGTVVVKISASHMMQARLIREQIEVGVVRQACAQGLAAPEIARLEALMAEQRAALERCDIVGFKAADEQFHQTLAEAAGLPLAWDMIADLKAHLDRACMLTLTDSAAMRPLIAQHQAIVDAITSGDADAAEQAMRLHLTEILRALPALMMQRADLFEQD